MSNIELVLPWNVVKTCYSLETNTQSCFLAVNAEEKTSSQITVKKQADESVKITVTVMALEESEGEEEEGPGLFEEPQPPKRGRRSKGKKKAEEEEATVGQSKIARLRQQGAKSPGKSTPGKTPTGKRAVRHEEEEEEMETESRMPVKRETEKKGQGSAVDADTIQEVIQFMQEQEQPDVEAGEVVADQVEITSVRTGRQKRQRPIYMPDPDEKTDVKVDEYDEEESESEEEPQIEIEQSGGSTIIIVKPPQGADDDGEEKVKGKGFYTKSRRPFKKRWSALPEGERYKAFYTGSETKRRRTNLYDYEATDEGVGRRRRSSASTPKRVPKDGNIECKYCDAMVTDYAYLYRHVRKMHSDMEDMQDYLDSLRPLMESNCPICNKVFASTSAIVAHIKSCHDEAETDVHCQSCDITFKNGVALRMHMKTVHGDEKKFECEICDMEFDDPESLTTHLGTHDVVQMHQCEICHKIYLSAGRLRRHKLIHGAFRFFCPYCSKGFHLKDNMNKHIRIVHENANSPVHRCPTCDKTFLVKGNLTQHIKGVHLRQFPFNCSNCKTGFRRVKSLEKHMKTCGTDFEVEDEDPQNQTIG